MQLTVTRLRSSNCLYVAFRLGVVRAADGRQGVGLWRGKLQRFSLMIVTGEDAGLETGDETSRSREDGGGDGCGRRALGWRRGMMKKDRGHDEREELPVEEGRGRWDRWSEIVVFGGPAGLGVDTCGWSLVRLHSRLRPLVQHPHLLASTAQLAAHLLRRGSLQNNHSTSSSPVLLSFLA